MNPETKIAILEERLSALKEEIHDIKKEISEIKEWSRENFKRIWDKENESGKGKGSVFGSILKLGN